MNQRRIGLLGRNLPEAGADVRHHLFWNRRDLEIFAFALHTGIEVGVLTTW